MQTAVLCLCLLSMAISTPVPPPPLPGRAGGNCMGQHRILLKGCNANHGFYIFKYVYSFLTRRNQTQIEKEEANSQSTGPIRQLGEDDARRGPTEDGAAPEQGSDGGTEVMENETGFKTENHTITSIGGDARGPRPGTSTWARSGVGIVGPTPASSEGSGDLDLVVEVDGGVSILPHGGHPGGAVVGNRSGIRSGDGDDGAPIWVPIEGSMTAGREKALTTGGAGDEGSGEATIPGRGQEDAVQGTGTGGAALSSVTEKTEDFQVHAKGVDEYAYIPESGSVTITQGKVGSTSITQISPNADDEVNIFVGKANIRVGERETSLASTTVGSEDDSILTMGTSSPTPRLDVATPRDGDDDDNTPARRQPERPATTATPSHGDRVTSSPADSRPTGDDEDGATTTGDGEGPVAPSPWRVSGGHVTVPTGAGGRGDDDKEVRGEGQRSRGRLGRPAVTTPRQEGDKDAAADPAKRASIRLGTTVASPGTSEGDCTTALGTTSGYERGASAVAGRGGSGEAGLATPRPREESQPGAGAKVRPGGVGLKKPPRLDKALSPHRKAGSQTSSKTQARAGSHGSDAGGKLHTAEVGSSPPLQVGQARGSVVVGEGREQDRGDETGMKAAGEGQEQGRGDEAGVKAAGEGRERDRGDETGMKAAGKGQERGRGGEAGVKAAGKGQERGRGGEAGVKAAGKGQERGRGREAGVKAVGEGQEQGRGGEAGVKEAGEGQEQGRGGEAGVKEAGEGQEQHRGGEAGVKAGGEGQEWGRGGEAGVKAAGEGQERGRGGKDGVKAAGEGQERGRGGKDGVKAAGEGQERGRGGEVSVMAAGAGGSRLPGHHGRRPGAAALGAFTALGRSRQVDQVRRADELHVRERAFYTLGGAGGGPHGPYTGLGSADSSQSSEGEQGSDSRQVGRRPSGLGAPGYHHSRWSRGTL
ncbi:matrix extracellular phosphoglycoprotein [Patagioenas fasciata]|uniref:matrix extracellular phosphoglycoprotein n=1 Tax=Patagioenas fasciata TaxID=372321 RepID=UPI003A996338